MSDVVRGAGESAGRPFFSRAVRRVSRPMIRPVLDRLGASEALTQARLDEVTRSLDAVSARLKEMDDVLRGLSQRTDVFHYTSTAQLDTEITALKLMVTKLPWIDELYADDTRIKEGVPGTGHTLTALIDQVAEVYQDVTIKDQLIAEGVRACAPRAKQILPVIGKRDVVLEVGSSFGYFARHIAAANPDVLVVSVEKDPASVALQRHLLAAEGVENVILVQGEMSLDWLRKVNQSCTFFDTVLLLSVLHHMPPDKVARMIEEFGALGRSLVVEAPAPNEAGACGQGTFDVLHKGDGIAGLLTNHTSRPLGDSSTHLDPELRREIVLFENANFSRRSQRSYIGDPFLKPENQQFEFLRDKKGTWNFTKGEEAAPYEPGVSLWDIRDLGRIVWPSPPLLRAQFREELDKVAPEGRTDVRPWNVVYTAKGLRIIDTKNVRGDAGQPADTDRVRNWLAMLDV